MGQDSGIELGMGVKEDKLLVPFHVRGSVVHQSLCDLGKVTSPSVSRSVNQVPCWNSMISKINVCAALWGKDLKKQNKRKQKHKTPLCSEVRKKHDPGVRFS